MEFLPPFQDSENGYKIQAFQESSSSTKEYSQVNGHKQLRYY